MWIRIRAVSQVIDIDLVFPDTILRACDKQPHGEQTQRDNGTTWTVQVIIMSYHLIRRIDDNVGMLVELVTRANVSTPCSYAYFVLNDNSNPDWKLPSPCSFYIRIDRHAIRYWTFAIEDELYSSLQGSSIKFKTYACTVFYLEQESLTKVCHILGILCMLHASYSPVESKELNKWFYTTGHPLEKSIAFHPKSFWLSA